MYEEEELREAFNVVANTKKTRLNWVMGVVLTYNLLFINFKVSPKIILGSSHTDKLIIPTFELFALQINIIFWVVLVAILVFYIEKDRWQVLNYLVFYILFVAVIVPVYIVQHEVYLFIWILSVGIYGIWCTVTQSLPFIMYPINQRWYYYKQQHQQAFKSTILRHNSNDS